MTSGSLESIGSLVRQLLSKFQPENDCKKISQLNSYSMAIGVHRQKKLAQSHEQLQGTSYFFYL